MGKYGRHTDDFLKDTLTNLFQYLKVIYIYGNCPMTFKVISELSYISFILSPKVFGKRNRTSTF